MPRPWYTGVDGFVVKSLNFAQPNAGPSMCAYGRDDIRILQVLCADMSNAYSGKATTIAEETKRKLAK